MYGYYSSWLRFVMGDGAFTIGLPNVLLGSCVFYRIDGSLFDAVCKRMMIDVPFSQII